MQAQTLNLFKSFYGESLNNYKKIYKRTMKVLLQEIRPLFEIISFRCH